jgi:RNA polymerase sigma-70 factor (ECF subfamily)
LAEQDVSLWNAAMIEEAEALLRYASTLGCIGRYQLEAALQSAHVERRHTRRTEWTVEVQLYDALFALSGSPVVALNRALAIAEWKGPAAALEIVNTLAVDGRLAQYQPYWAARAALLARTHAYSEAHDAYDIAIGLERDPEIRRFLQGQQAAVVDRLI